MTNCSAIADLYGIASIPDAEIYFNATFLSVVMVTTVVGNALALHAFFISSELKQITYYFIASLCVSDLLIAFFSISLWIVDLVNRWGWGCNWKLPPELQYTYQCVDIFGGTWSIMSLAFISVERYICIKHALHYAHIMTTRRVYISFVFLFLYCITVTVVQGAFISEKDPGHLVKQLGIFFMAYLLPVFIKVFSYSKIYHEAKRQQAQIQQLHRYAQTLANANTDTNKSLDSLSGDSMKTASTNIGSNHSRPDSTSTDTDGKRRRSKPPETEDDCPEREKMSCVRFFSCYDHRHLDETESTSCLDCSECERTKEEAVGNGNDYVMKLSRSLSYRSNKTARTDTITEFSKTDHHELRDLAEHPRGTHRIEAVDTNGTTFSPPKEAELFRNDHTHTSSCIEDQLVDKLQFASAEDGSIEQRPRRTFSMGDGYREHVTDTLSPLSALEECQSKQRCSEGANLSPVSAMSVHNKHRHSEGSHHMMKKIRSFSKWSPATSPLLSRRCSKKKPSEQKRNEHKIRRFKKELRAAKVVALIMGTFLICWTPFNVLILCYAFHVGTTMRSIMICKLLHYTNSAINPILYVVLNKVYRSAVVKVIKKFKIFSNNW